VHPGYFDVHESSLGHRRISLLNEAFNGEVLDSELPPIERLSPLVAATSVEPGTVLGALPTVEPQELSKQDSPTE
jgi:hypothetical protein